jgi:hypothetical protein
MNLDLTDDETAALVELLRRAINDDPYPLSQRLAPLKAIDWHTRLVCSGCGSRRVEFVVTGTDRR